MTRYLADSHILLWALDGDQRLPSRHADILNSRSVVFASMASLWEITIKSSIGRLNAPPNLGHYLLLADYRILDIKASHVEAIRDLPLHSDHRDPFDRLLIAQARVEELCILTVDRQFNSYDVRVI